MVSALFLSPANEKSMHVGGTALVWRKFKPKPKTTTWTANFQSQDDFELCLLGME
jgi:hypothetical protein